jgi:hypothetical protein
MATTVEMVRKALAAAVAASVPGDLVSISALRRTVRLSKRAFDAAVLAMVDADEVNVHLHDLPMSLPKAERDALVVHPDGTHFCAIAPRRRK